MNVVVADRDEARLHSEASRLDSDDNVLAIAVDVRDTDAVDRLADSAVTRSGALHAAVDNAGVVNRGKAWQLTLDDRHAVLDINLWGVIHGVRSFVPRILATADEAMS